MWIIIYSLLVTIIQGYTVPPSATILPTFADVPIDDVEIIVRKYFILQLILTEIDNIIKTSLKVMNVSNIVLGRGLVYTVYN